MTASAPQVPVATRPAAERAPAPADVASAPADRGPGPAADRAPTLAAVVPATAPAPTLARCLRALRAGTRAPDELLVADRPAGAGPALARNLAARRASAEVIVFVDADVAVHRDALARIAAVFAADSQLTAVFGAYDDRPAAPGVVSQFRNLLHHHVHSTSAGPAETFWAGLGAVRRDEFLATGGFDAERYPVPAVEDIELGMRLSAGGALIRLEPAIRGTHLKRWTLLGMIRTDFARRGLPWARLIIAARRAEPARGRGRRRSRPLNLAPRHAASAALSVGLLAGALTRRPAAAGAALAALAAANARFYALLARRGGARLALAGAGLHVVHHLTATAAATVAVALAAIERRPDGDRTQAECDD